MPKKAKTAEIAMPKTAESPSAAAAAAEPDPVLAPAITDPAILMRRKNRNIRLTAWVQASRQHGFLKKGQKFNTIPKKGTPEHAAIKEAYTALVAEWLAEGDIPEEFRRPSVDINVTVCQKRKRRSSKKAAAKNEPKKKRAKTADPESCDQCAEKKKQKKPRAPRKAKKPTISIDTHEEPAVESSAEPLTPKANSTPRVAPSPKKSPCAAVSPAKPLVSPKSPKSPMSV